MVYSAQYSTSISVGKQAEKLMQTQMKKKQMQDGKKYVIATTRPQNAAPSMQLIPNRKEKKKGKKRKRTLCVSSPPPPTQRSAVPYTWRLICAYSSTIIQMPQPKCSRNPRITHTPYPSCSICHIPFHIVFTLLPTQRNATQLIQMGSTQPHPPKQQHDGGKKAQPSLPPDARFLRHAQHTRHGTFNFESGSFKLVVHFLGERG